MTPLSDLIARLEAEQNAHAIWCSDCGLLILEGETLRRGECDTPLAHGTARQAAASLKAREAGR